MEVKMQDKKIKAENLKKMGQQMQQANGNNVNQVETSDNIPDSEGGKYHVSEVIKVHLGSKKSYDIQIEYLDNNSKSSS